MNRAWKFNNKNSRIQKYHFQYDLKIYEPIEGKNIQSS